MYRTRQLTCFQRKNIVSRHKQAQENEDMRQKYNRRYADKTRNAKKSEIKVRVHVLVKQPKANKLTRNFNQIPYIVIHRNKMAVRARNIIERNVTHFKRIPKPSTEDDGYISEDMEGLQHK